MDETTNINSSVLLVNEHDEVLDRAEKLYVHQIGLLHRAFSVLIFNDKGDYLLQQRAQEKYHSAGLWSNSCCGHPIHSTNTEAQAQQRLFEEMGFRTTLRPLLSFQYKAMLPNGLIEHEIDHVFVGNYEGVIPFNRDEVCAIRWVSPDVLAEELSTFPENFTVWFQLIFDRLQQSIVS